MSSNNSSIYSPLPQSLSDSDSEKEMTDPNQIKYNRMIPNGIPKKVDDSAPYHNGYSIPNHIIDKPKAKPGFAGMSPVRKVGFLFSIALCFVTIFVFLWALPCSEGTCPVKISNWDQIYPNLELKGGVNIVQGVHGLNLVLLFRTGLNSTRVNEGGLGKSRGVGGEGLNGETVNNGGMNREGMNREGVNREGVNREGVNREGVNREGVNIEGVNREGVIREGVNRGLNVEGTNGASLNNKPSKVKGTNTEEINVEEINAEKINAEEINAEEINEEEIHTEGINGILGNGDILGTAGGILGSTGGILANKGGGVVSVQGNNGVLAWLIPQVHAPEHIDCNMLDINGDGILDCLLLGDKGVVAIEPVSGNIIWHVHTDYETKPIKNMEFPTVVPDLNDDGIHDLVMKLNVPGNKCIVVSGNTGIVLYEFVLNHCESVQGIIHHDHNFIYLCRNKTGDAYYRIAVSDLSIRVYNRNYDIVSKKVDYRIDGDNVYVKSGCKLIVENEGNCPNCKANITLIDEKSNKLLWAYSHAMTYAMKPSSFSFKPSETNVNNLKGHINGFIIKMWQWSRMPHTRRQFNTNYESNKMLNKRSVPITNSSNLKINYITERVVLITFNDSTIHVTNSSSTEITQLCIPTEKSDYVCQPDLKNQNDSLLIGDLDDDGSQELISFSSSYDIKTGYQLVSNVKVICLEAELPKLYEIAK